jgi:hypothetical protein
MASGSETPRHLQPGPSDRGPVAAEDAGDGGRGYQGHLKEHPALAAAAECDLEYIIVFGVDGTNEVGEWFPDPVAEAIAYVSVDYLGPAN